MIICLLLLTLAGQAMSANVLIVGLVLSHSHHLWIESIALKLVDRGHNVTFLSLDPTKVKRENYTVINLEGIHEMFSSGYLDTSFQQTSIYPWKIPTFINYLNEFFLDICKEEIKHPTIHNKLLKYPKDYKFDIILWDHVIGECMYPIIERFGNPPLIGLSPFGIFEGLDQIYGGHSFLYVRSTSMPIYKLKTTYARFLNAINIFYGQYFRKTWFKRKCVESSKKYFPQWSEQKFDEIENNFSVVLINWDSNINQPQPLPLNMIPIGGIQINDKESLSKHLQEIYSIPSNGIIFFSLGSNIKSENLTINVLQSFAQCFEEISDYQIVWKIKPPSSLKLPSNVHNVSWARQHAVLNHPKTKLFITHGGGLSSQETTYFGIPVVLIPILLDQINNAEELKSKGSGEIVNFQELLKSTNSKDIFCSTVKQVLFTEKYTQTAKTLSRRYRDWQNSPMETAVYWVEYVLRHGGAKHLETVERHMCGFYSQNLDIYLILAVVIGVVLRVVVMMLECVYRLLFGKREEKKEKTKKA